MSWSEIILFLLAIEFFVLGGMALLGALLWYRKRFYPRGLFLGLAGITCLGLSVASASSYEYFANQRAGLSAQSGPTRADIAAAGAMTSEARREMIEGMVGRLAVRMRDNPKDLTGWLRLGRAYSVLGRREDAIKAYKSAKRYFPNETVGIERLIQELGRGN